MVASRSVHSSGPQADPSSPAKKLAWSASRWQTAYASLASSGAIGTSVTTERSARSTRPPLYAMSGVGSTPQRRSRPSRDSGMREEHSTNVCPASRTARMAATVREERVRRWSSSVPSTSEQKSVMRWAATASEAELARRLGRAVPQELRAAGLLVALADGAGRSGERSEGTKEAAVGLVRPRHRALPAPAGLAQRVERTVIAGAGVRVRLDVAVTVAERVLGEDRPREGARGEGRRHLHRVDAGLELLGGRVDRKTGLRDAEQVVA